MMGLIVSFPRRVGLNLGSSTKLKTNWTKCRVASITTITSTEEAPAASSGNISADPPAKPTDNLGPNFDIDEYMKQAKEKIASRETKFSLDNLAPTPSRLLALALADHLPKFFQEDITHDTTHQLSQLGTRPAQLPIGYHLLHFPLQVPSSGLMPDGTDKDHFPGWPFVRRMWAGGSITFTHHSKLRLDGRPVYCAETLGEPVLKSTSVLGSEKVFIDIRRRYGLGSPFPQNVTGSAPHPDDMVVGDSSRGVLIDETRQLVFLKERTTPLPPQPEVTPSAPIRRSPDITFNLTPDQTLLFHFSALTYNAHAIHLDTNYAKNVEGYRGLLVHGPLTLVLMLTGLQAQCKNDNKNVLETTDSVPNTHDWVVKSIDYRNLRPLYAGEKMTVCLKLTQAKVPRLINGTLQPTQKNWKVWIEGPDGRLAVKGEAVTVQEPVDRA